jgi:hypothetical protein
MTRRFRLLLALLAEAWPVWVGVGMPVLAWFAAPFCFPGSRSIQYLGVVLETSGVVVVAYELIEIREQFDSPSVSAIVRRWLVRLRDIFSPTALASAETSASAVAASERNDKARANRSIPDQIVVMMKLVDEIYRRLDALQRLRALEERLATESQQATSELKLLRSQIRTLSLGNIGREFVGACLIILGLLMANLPEDFHRLWLALTQ